MKKIIEQLLDNGNILEISLCDGRTVYANGICYNFSSFFDDDVIVIRFIFDLSNWKIKEDNHLEFVKTSQIVSFRIYDVKNV